MANTYIYKDMTGNTPSTKMTFSCWLKKSNPATDGRIFGAQSIACHAYWLSSGELRCDLAARDSSTSLGALKTNRKFRDTNAWYHIVYALDTTLNTADDRLKIWVNGVQETSFASRSNPAQNGTTAYGDDGYYSVGARMSQQGGAGHYFDGLMSHVHYCDGYAYQASDFGETDATTGEWKIKTSPSVTHGTNGFFLKMENSANMDLDSSTNNHSFTTSGTLTKTEDCPSNVFNTWNPLDNYYENGGFLNGNTTFQTTNSNYGRNTSTLGMTSGKFYWEVKPSATNSQSDYFPHIGITASQITHSQDFVGKAATDYAYATNSDGTGYKKWNNNSGTSYGSNFAINDIVGVALDLDNNKIYFSKNGTWQNSGDPTSGSTGTGAAFTVTAAASTPLGAYFPSVSNYDGTGNVTFQANFGNGYFGTTAVSSAGTNASGNGIFEYDVPAGYTAISTKGFNL